MVKVKPPLASRLEEKDKERNCDATLDKTGFLGPGLSQQKPGNSLLIMRLFKCYVVLF